VRRRAVDLAAEAERLRAVAVDSRRRADVAIGRGGLSVATQRDVDRLHHIADLATNEVRHLGFRP
jgi:hypothetical protein